jgi:hypothetical protein
MGRMSRLNSTVLGGVLWKRELIGQTASPATARIQRVAVFDLEKGKEDAWATAPNQCSGKTGRRPTHLFAIDTRWCGGLDPPPRGQRSWIKKPQSRHSATPDFVGERLLRPGGPATHIDRKSGQLRGAKAAKVNSALLLPDLAAVGAW